MNNKNLPTIVALSTAPGMSAIAVIRMSGERSFFILGKIFSIKNAHHKPFPQVVFGKICDEEGIEIDEVLLTLFKAPHSYTGEDVVEISCHGSVFIIHRILNLLTRLGAELAMPGEFTQRAFLNGKMDLSQAEAVADLIASETEAAHRLAINQLKGGIRNEIAELRSQLLQFQSLIELELDFSEEDVEFADRLQFKKLLAQICKRIQDLLDSFQLGNAIRSGILTVIAGKPNAGKSTLLNLLLNDERALVSDIPGTTRDTIEERLNLRGLLFHFIDTAGLRESDDKIEQLGVLRAKEKIGQADILMYVFDPGELDAISLKKELDALQAYGSGVIVVVNKIDLYPNTELQSYQSTLPENCRLLTLAARSGFNKEALVNELYQIGTGHRNLESIPFAINARHLKSLQQAMLALRDAERLLVTNEATDLLAQSIRRASYELSEISGEIHTDEILGNIFSKFCIGK